jgi:(2Fe-2S) ferredoxin
MSRFKRHIFICVNQRQAGHPKGCCADKGSVALRDFFKEEVARLGLKGAVRANKSGCLDACANGPTVVVYPDGVWYWVGTKADVTEIMERHIVKGEIVERLLMPDPDRPLMPFPLEPPDPAR